MTLPGGAADKSGNRYEGLWTAYCMTEVMAEQASTIRLEPPGSAGEGVEFFLEKNGIREFHQVKRQHSGLGHWSLAVLKQEQVLSHFWNKLTATADHCVFVSAYAAHELATLSQRARDAQSFQEFEAEFIQFKGAAADFVKLRGYWQNCSSTEAYEALQRVHVRTSDEVTLRSQVEYRLATLVEGDASTALAALTQFALEQLHQELRAIDLWQYLEAKEGLHRRCWNNDPHILASVDTANARYLNPIHQDAIAGAVIPRKEVADAMNTLSVPSGKSNVLFTGNAGTGKSGVGLQVVEAVRKIGWPVLAFRIDRLATMLSPKDVGRQLDLPESPVTVLANIAQRQDCLLLIDQLDAVSKVSGRNPQYFNCVGEMINQAKAHPKMRLALLCRKFDIENDERLRPLIGQNGIAVENSCWLSISGSGP